VGKNSVRGGRKGRRLFGGFFIFIFYYYNMGILVILTPKTTLFWVFHPFSQFHLTDEAILYVVGSLGGYFIPIESLKG
jgi:hypothetical protein